MNHVLLYHALFGGNIQSLADQFSLSTSQIHRILDKAKTDNLYNWKLNKNGELNKDYINIYGKELIKYISESSKICSEEHVIPLNKAKRLVAIADAHYPFNIPFTGFERFLGDYLPDVLIYLGDFIDVPYLSKYEKNNKLMLGNKLRQEYDEVMAIMDRHINISKASEIYYIEGNHEYRVRKFLEDYPAGEGFIEIPIAMKLKDRGIKWVELNDWVRIGNIFFTHGMYHNTYHARKHLDTHQRNIIYGHLHTNQVHSGYHPFDKDLPYVAKSIPCFCELNPAYMRNRPNQWLNGLYQCEIEESGLFWDNTIVIVNGEFRIIGTNKRYTNGS
jgi:predicted phosphodiesterase